MRLFTIGFTRTTAEHFFSRLHKAGVTRVLDVRLNNVSQLAGFAKKDDLRYFLRELCSMDYLHLPEFAPTQELLDEYKRDGGTWDDYARKFLCLLESRRVEAHVSRGVLDGACLLCSEPEPHHCHRRLVAEYLSQKWGDVEIAHL
ncbi:MAG TPA: DUF488 domain-containing protein [Polyangiaceae bacterium]